MLDQAGAAGVLGGEVSNVGIDRGVEGLVGLVVARVVRWLVWLGSALSVKDTVRRWPGDE